MDANETKAPATASLGSRAVAPAVPVAVREIAGGSGKGCVAVQGGRLCGCVGRQSCIFCKPTGEDEDEDEEVLTAEKAKESDGGGDMAGDESSATRPRAPGVQAEQSPEGLSLPIHIHIHRSERERERSLYLSISI